MNTIYELSRGRRRARAAYTLVEILIATVLTLVMMAAVVQVFANVGKTVNNTRAIMEVQNQLRLASNRLIKDLDCITVQLNKPPPRSPSTNEGYFEYIEGPIGPVVPVWNITTQKSVGKNTIDSGSTSEDTTLGDIDDILMFTMQTRGQPFVGRCSLATDGSQVIESRQAEVVWFVRGRTLYRRVLLVAPNLNNTLGVLPALSNGFYLNNDISVRQERDPSNNNLRFVANSLGDLTKRENRFAHGVANQLPATDWPFDARRWGQLGLPTLRECSYVNSGNSNLSWNAGGVKPLNLSEWSKGIDLWSPVPVSLDFSSSLWDPTQIDASSLTMKSASTGYMYYDPNPSRMAEDVVLNNVIGFDVKVWDPNAPVLDVVRNVNGVNQDIVLVPGDPEYTNAVNAIPGNATIISYGAYVDLNYMCRLGPEKNPSPPDPSAPYPAYNDVCKANGLPVPLFFGAGNRLSGLRGTAPNVNPPTSPWPAAAVYDTGSNHYDNNWIDLNGNGKKDPGIDFGDDNGDGVIDDGTESTPPYQPTNGIRGIQIKIRVFEPASKQVREVTIGQDFLAK